MTAREPRTWKPEWRKKTPIPRDAAIVAVIFVVFLFAKYHSFLEAIFTGLLVIPFYIAVILLRQWRMSRSLLKIGDGPMLAMRPAHSGMRV